VEKKISKTTREAEWQTDKVGQQWNVPKKWKSLCQVRLDFFLGSNQERKEEIELERE
jgi:hypothetical protein